MYLDHWLCTRWWVCTGDYELFVCVGARVFTLWKVACVIGVQSLCWLSSVGAASTTWQRFKGTLHYQQAVLLVGRTCVLLLLLVEVVVSFFPQYVKSAALETLLCCCFSSTRLCTINATYRNYSERPYSLFHRVEAVRGLWNTTAGWQIVPRRLIAAPTLLPAKSAGRRSS